jgi:transcription termination/antitermination protein NusA
MNKKDILLVVDSLSNEKGVAREIIFKAIELALAAVAAKNAPPETVDIQVNIDRDTGEYETFRQWIVVEDDKVEFPEKEIEITRAREKYPKLKLEIGEVIAEPMEATEFGRIAAQQAKQIIVREIRRAERDEVAKQYQKKVGTLVNGAVKRVTRDSILLDIGGGIEAIIPKEELIPHEVVYVGDRMRGVLIKVINDQKGLQLIVSRVKPEMLAQLFKIEVPEIGEEIIDVKAVARDPGSRAKVAVKTNDGRIDPIGACIGVRGSRVQVVSNELQGERIDIVLWNDDPAQLVVNAMAPAEVASIVVDEEAHSMDIAVRADQLAQAIGRNGQNVQLASKLSGWKINVMTENDLKEKAKISSVDLVTLFKENLDVDEDFAGILVQEGFTSLEDIAYMPLEEMLSIEGIDNDIAEELQNRARNALLSKVLTGEEKLGAVEPAQDLLELEGMTRHLAYILASQGVVTREDLAEQSVDELSNIEELTEEQAAKLIMSARAHWFK